ncbi:hypothetical protein NEOLEDRAFT_1058034 [Neolentinus lepideus HHB14362 ss-1]|uniref:Golgi apparatus membrane protein TVP38 n=1 Tax=Neolentinus lepideus HHB14362 ss-1 TaxID=1314782 RepID=A0A165UUF6_9AGAM|nr:hypothetical protein NEOLEDRAFT_1058034 [Neolentinus lepideus HHB14362 ss-1]
MTPLNSSLETLFVDNVLRLPPDNPDPTAPPAIATSLLDSSSLDERDSLAVDRTVVRTPSPTPSEAVVYSNSWIFLDWRKYINWRYWIKGRRKWLLVPLPFVAAFVALVSIYHDDIVRFLTPVANWMHDTKGGFMIPISVLFILSFPPLWGHEVVALVCGLVWGLWIGFGIVSAGTFIGEIGNFYAFRYCLRPRCEKWEKTKIAYACLTRVVREGGFRVVLIARYSAIPPHFTTAVFSTCGVGIVSFSLAAILSLPRQLLNVYLGVIFLQTSEGGQSDKKITWPLAIGTILTTIVAMWYILWKMKNVRPEVIYARRKARCVKTFVYNASALRTSVW